MTGHSILDTLSCRMQRFQPFVFGTMVSTVLSDGLLTVLVSEDRRQ